MANYVISGLQTTQQALEGNDTLLVESVGSIVYSGNDAIIWNLTPAASVPPGVVIVNDGLIQSLTDRAIDTSGNNGSSPRTFSLTNRGTITSPDDAVRIARLVCLVVRSRAHTLSSHGASMRVHDGSRRVTRRTSACAVFRRFDRCPQ